MKYRIQKGCSQSVSQTIQSANRSPAEKGHEERRGVVHGRKEWIRSWLKQRNREASGTEG
jgi:hypothetical protein